MRAKSLSAGKGNYKYGKGKNYNKLCGVGLEFVESI